MKPRLFLLPNLLGEHEHHSIFLPASVDRAVETIDGLISESAQGGRRFLSRFNTKKPTNEIPIALYNKNSKPDEIDFLLEPIIKSGERWGLLSDAGLPCIADPGHLLVMRAKLLGITVQAFVGPSAITLALMLSGLPAQRFAFQGYLAKSSDEQQAEIAQLEAQSKKQESTQVFIEAPHRNYQTLKTLLATLNPNTILSLAWDLTLPSQGVITQTVETWLKSPLPNLEKRCTTFLFYA